MAGAGQHDAAGGGLNGVRVSGEENGTQRDVAHTLYRYIAGSWAGVTRNPLL